MKEEKEYLEIDASNLVNDAVPEEISKKLRVSQADFAVQKALPY